MSLRGARPTRRELLVAGGCLTIAGVTGAMRQAADEEPAPPGATSPSPEAAAPAAPIERPDVYDPEQRYLDLVGGPEGVLYAIQADGKLLWHRHSGWREGTADWAPGSGRVIGTGWHRYRTVLGGEDGSLYGVGGDGTIVHTVYTLADAESGDGTWSPEREIGSGFDRFARVFGYDGHIYGLTSNGTMYHFRHEPGAARIRGGGQIASSFRALHFGADTDGVIYSYFGNGLSCHRYAGGGQWASGGSGQQIAKNIFELADFGTMVFAGSGRVYYIGPSDPRRGHEGRMLLHRLENYATAADTKTVHWSTATPAVAGTGWTLGRQANLQGYPLNLSVANGQTLRAAVSTTFSEVEVSVVRLAPAGHAPVTVTHRPRLADRLQPMRLGYVHDGCGWEPSVEVPVADDWPSGVYAVRLTPPDGPARHIPFVVRPARAARPIAVILPTNTYLAYSTYGGHSQYCGCPHLKGARRRLSFHRPFPYDLTDQGGRPDFTLPTDLKLLRWMAAQGFGFDVYTDEDLDREPGLLTPYRAVVLPSHPEYYSERQRRHLLEFQRGGASTLYLGGNGLYERVTFSDDRTALVFRRADGARDVYHAIGKPASELLGTNWNSHNYWTFAPYRVVRDHPLFEGTGLTVGSVFGAYGDNGPASGGEIDCRIGRSHEADDESVIAVGENKGGGAEMVVRDDPFLFSVSSISFTGALFTSDGLSTLLRNAFNRALGTAA